MNTLRDTDEGKAKPSVWPVYVMSVVIGLLSLISLAWVWLVPWMAQGYTEYPQYFQQLSPGAHQFAHMMQRLVPYAPLFGLHGLFGIVTAVAAARLRSWGWWCAVIWLAAYSLWHVFLTVNLGIAEVSLTASLVTAAFYGLIIWLLATRRQLFFPAKSKMVTVTGKKRPRYQVVLFVVVPLVLVVVGSAVLVKTVPRNAGEQVWFGMLPEKEQKPEAFEPYLAAHPDDLARREAALVWYSFREPDDQKLKAHTFEMARWHPNSDELFFTNITLFYLDPEYRERVTDVLEAQIEQYTDDHHFFWVLAMTCEHNAIPPKCEQAVDRERWLQYYGLPSDYQIPVEINHERAEKAIAYYRRAIAAAEGEDFYPAFYSEQLADLLMALERYEEALVACEAALPHVEEVSKPGLYLSYATCLREADRIEDARNALQEVIAADHEGFDGGPGHYAAYAYLMLGRIALEQDHDVETASKHLLSAVSVEPCCHTTTQGMPLHLARKLLEAGRYEPVEDFCGTIISKFIKTHRPTEELLEKARSMKAEDQGGEGQTY